MTLQNFRAFPFLQAAGLERVNLFVGKNNSGKTSILEAVEILSAGGSPAVLWRGPRRRGEYSPPSEDMRPGGEVEIRHLFHGHQLSIGTSFTIQSQNGQAETAACEVIAAPVDSGALPLFSLSDRTENLPPLALKFSGSRLPEPVVYPLSANGSISPELRRRYPPLPNAGPVGFLGTEGVDLQLLSSLWDSVVLTPEEERVVDTIRIIEPGVERIAFAGRGAYVKFQGSDERIPIGSMGDGTRRLLAIALHLARASGGVLLIDEIDTGLHHSALEQLWALVVEGARRLNVQVFATSHSGDCVRALAWLHDSSSSGVGTVALHRLERGEPATTRYSVSELSIAARHHIEVRG